MHTNLKLKSVPPALYFSISLPRGIFSTVLYQRQTLAAELRYRVCREHSIERNNNLEER